MVNLYFFDSSALVKRYVNEGGSRWVHAMTATTTSNIVLVSRITRVEVVSALARLQREGNIAPSNITRTLQLFQYDWMTQYQIIELDQSITEHAGQLVQTYPLRAYDSVQLASALSVYPFFSTIDPQIFTFVCADDRLLTVAQTEGMPIENPNTYP
jgi:predicted nucleic acid-binding protein